jgi:DNA-binding NtrC family response regulator
MLDRLLDEDRPELLDWITDHAVRRAYAHGGGSQVQAAKLLGISRNVFRTLMKRAGLLTGEGRVGRVVEEAHQQLLTR